ncbi:MAG: hypothetical protein QNJ46_05990 [Leptolyngbyaceae cyanobacterium MO_188.B28]|nr:hypothetical protein [Leptolyngbyaceae cyanobacterium MO_188.B28]
MSEEIQEKLNAAKSERLQGESELAVIQPQDISIAQFNSGAELLRASNPVQYALIQRQLMQQVYESLMIKDTDYGKVEGCGDKPMLFKAGAEKVANVFNLSIGIERVRETEDFDKGLFSYTYKAIIRDRNNRVLAECEGNCNSKEKKYAFRWVPERFATEEQKNNKQGRKKSKKYPNSYDILVPNDDIYSIVNTLMKMSQKRAIVGGILLATNSSAFFGNAEVEMMQDYQASVDSPYESIDAELVPEDESPVMVSQSQIKRLYAIAKKAGHSRESLKAMVLDIYKIDSFNDIPVSDYDAIAKSAEHPALVDHYTAQLEQSEPTPALD